MTLDADGSEKTCTRTTPGEPARAAMRVLAMQVQRIHTVYNLGARSQLSVADCSSNGRNCLFTSLVKMSVQVGSKDYVGPGETLAVGIVAVSLRVVARYRQKTAFGLDGWLIVSALVRIRSGFFNGYLDANINRYV